MNRRNAARLVMSAALLALAALAVGDGAGSARAAEPAAEAALRRLFVPAGDPSGWPRGDWEVVEAAEFAGLVRRSRPAPDGPAAASIQRVDYSARLAGVQLQGEFTATVRSEGRQSVLLPLGGMNIAVSDARWTAAGTPGGGTDGARRAWCGVAGDGMSYLVVPPGAGGGLILSGTWTRLGRELAEGVDFQFEGLPAAASSLTLEAPTGYTPKCSHGQVARLSADSRPDRAGVSRWRVELGSHPACRLAVQRDISPDVPSVVTAERETTWNLQVHEAPIQTRFDVWVTGQPADSLTFTLPQEIRLFSVTYGGESLISWRTEPEPAAGGTRGGSRQRVVVELPDPLLGKSRPFRLSGMVTPPFDRPWRLPEIELAGAALTRSSLSLAVSGTVELRSLDHPGWRQVLAGAGQDRQLSLGFEQYREDAPFRVELDHPPPNLAVTGFSHIDLRQAAAELRGSLSYSVRSGTVYELTCRLPADWDVLEVRPQSPGAVSQWATTVGADGDRILSAELRDGISPDRPLALAVRCRRSDGPAAAGLALPVFRPVEVGKLSLSVALTTPRTVVADLEPGGPVDFVGPDGWPTDSFAALPPATSDSLTTVWRFGSPWSEGRLTLRPLETTADDRAAADEPSDAQLAPAEAPSDPAAERPVADALAMLALVTRCDPAPGGRDRHRAHFRFSAPTALPGSVRLPGSAAVQRVLIDGAAAAVFETDAGFDFPAAPPPCRELTVEYDTPAHGGVLFRELAVFPPDVGVRVVRKEWTVETADESLLVGSAAWLRRGGRPTAATWSERLFGPLGRAAGDDLFNPLSTDDWRGLWAPAEPESGARTAARRFEFLGAGHRGALTARWMPQRVARTARWVLFLVALATVAALRALRVRRRRTVLAVLLTLAATPAVVLTDPGATFCGSVLAGLLVGALLPTRLLRRRGAEAPATSGGNSTTLHWARPAGAVVLAALALGGLSRADEPAKSATESATAPVTTPATASAAPPLIANAAGETAEAEGPAWDVLVPVGADGSPAPAGLVYVRRDVLAALRKPRADEPPRYLLTASHYEASVEDGSVVRVAAAIEVVPLVAGPVDVRLAFDGANLARPDCLVDGVPTVPTVAADGSLSVRVPWSGPAVAVGVGTAADGSGATEPVHVPTDSPARIELELLVPRPRKGAGPAFGFGLPLTPSNQLLARFGFPVESLVVTAGDGAIRRTGEFGLAAVQFGPAATVRVQWGRVNAEALPRSFTAFTRSLVTVNPLSVRHRARIACRVEGEPLRTLELSLPASALVHEVGGDEVARWTVIENPPPAGRPGQSGRRVLLEFAAPRAGDFSIEVVYEAPRNGRGGPHSQVVLSPRDIAAPVEPAPTAPAAGFAVGIDAKSGYLVELAGNAPPGVRSVPPEQFAADFRQSLVRGESVRPPALALHADRPVPLRLSLGPKAVTRRVALAQRGLITQREMTWELLADVEVSGAAAYAHELLVPPRFEVTDVSVVEDEAERLARWSRAGRRLTLWLGGGTSGRQRIHLRGRLPFQPGQPVALPVVGFVNAEIRSYRVQLDRSPRTTVQFAGAVPSAAPAARAASPETAVPAIAAGSAEAVEVASWPAPTAVPPEVIVTRLPTPLTFETLTAVRPVDRRRIEVSAWVSVENPARTNRLLALIAPPGLPLSVAEVVRSDGRRTAVRALTRPGATGRIFGLEEPLAPHASAVLRLTGTIDRADDGRGELPLMRIPDGRPRARYLWTPWPVAGAAVGQSAKNGNAAPAPPALPAWAQAAGVKLPEGSGTLVNLDPSADVWGVDWPGSATADRRAYAETALFLTGDGSSYFGRTSLLISAGRAATFEMLWPKELRCDAVLLDGEAVPADVAPGALLGIPVPAGRPATVVVLWSAAGGPAGLLDVDLDADTVGEVVLPRLPAGLKAEHTLIAVPPPGVSMLTAHPQAPTSLDIAIERVARLLDWWSPGDEPPPEATPPETVPPVLSAAWAELETLAAEAGDSLPARDRDRVKRLRRDLAGLAGGDFDRAPHVTTNAEPSPLAGPSGSLEPLVPLAGLPPEAWLMSADGSGHRPSVWAAGGTAGRAAVGTLLFAGLCVVTVWLAGSGMIRPLRRHPAVSCVLGGLLWWTCWTWSAAGLALVLGGALGLWLNHRSSETASAEPSPPAPAWTE